MAEFYKTCLAAATSKEQQMCLRHGDSENRVQQNVQWVHFSWLEHVTKRQTASLPATDLLTLHHITPVNCIDIKKHLHHPEITKHMLAPCHHIIWLSHCPLTISAENWHTVTDVPGNVHTNLKNFGFSMIFFIFDLEAHMGQTDMYGYGWTDGQMGRTCSVPY